MTGAVRVAAALAVGLACATGCDVYQTLPPQAGIEEPALDWSVNPCDDFYQFACGNWRTWHPIPAFNATVNRVGYVQDDLIASLYAIVVDDATGRFGHPDDPDAVKIGDYYASCRSAKQVDGAIPTALASQLQRISGVNAADKLPAVLAGLHADGVGALFGLFIGRDPGDPTREIIHVGDGGTTMYRSYYLDAELGAYLSRYRRHVENLSDILRQQGLNLAIDLEAVIRVESALATAALTTAAGRDPHAIYNLTELAALRTAAPHFDWDAYLTAAGASGVTEVNVQNPAMPPALDALLATTPLADLRAYLAWRAVEEAAPALGPSVALEEFLFHEALFLGRTSPLPDYWKCFIATANNLGFSVSRPFVAERFGSNAREATTALMASLRAAMGDTLAGLTWLDEPTRTAATDKLDAVIANVGFPDVWPSIDDVPISRNGYLDNRIALARNGWMKALGRLDQPASREGWAAPPWITNAFYSPDQNAITFPAGILQLPFFDVGRPPAANYGALGSVMGHELTHGFDDEGRQYDAAGTLRDWWTPDVAAEFSSRASCLAQNFDTFEPLPGLHIDGEQTLGENLADLGGLKLAHAAFHAPGGGAGVGAPGLFSPDQQFFIAFAQDWCENQRPAYLADLLRTDPHAPWRYRVNGAVANMSAFAEAFHCPAGARLAPVNRCEVW